MTSPPELFFISSLSPKISLTAPHSTICGVPSISVEMAPNRPRKTRRPAGNVLDILNNVNNPDANNTSERVARTRSQTTHQMGVYEIPVTPPEPESEPEPEPQPELKTEGVDSGRTLRSRLRSHDNPRPTPGRGPDESVNDLQVSFSQQNQPDGSPESTHHTNDPFEYGFHEFSNAEDEEELGDDSPQEQLDLEPFFNENDAHRQPQDNSPPDSQYQPSSGGSQSEPEDQLAVVIDHREGTHRTSGHARSADQDDPVPSNEPPSVPETPPTRHKPARQAVLAGGPSNIEEQAVEQLDEDDGHSTRGLRIWFIQAIEGSSAENNWRRLCCEGRSLRHYRENPIPDYLQGSRQLIAEIRSLYKEILDTTHLSGVQQNQLENLWESIFADAKQIFEFAAEKSRDRGEGSGMLDQFEAHLIPRMVNLVLFSFKTYRLLGQPARTQLHDTLNWLLQCCIRVDDYRKVGYLDPAVRSKSIRMPLKRLMKALRLGQLNDNVPAEAEFAQSEMLPSQERTRLDIPSSQAPWTPWEEAVLRDALEEYSGRYLHIC